MPRQRFTAEQIIGKLREVEVLVAKGAAVADASRQIADAVSVAEMDCLHLVV